MRLKDEIYQIIDKTEGEGYLIRLNRDSLIYRAHFPGSPITPGVCIIQMVTELLEENLGIKLELSEVTNAKFLAVIDPRNTDILTVSYPKIVDTGDGYKVTALINDTQTIYTKLSLTYHRK
ncbi:MAG: beta-hydroxyacyl-ACP dehydratase [Muribaculaceae bacterium]|nr:beta-hydroxyacyl-ACP dehydratase [Muribaculaceae bacterium]